MASSPTDMLDELEAYNCWSSALERLGGAVQEYVHASKLLEQSLRRKSREPARQRSSDSAFSKLCQTLPNLDFFEFNLQQVRLAFTRLHNSSHSLVPINSLPDDILTMIFSLATQEWINEDYQETGHNLFPLTPSTLSRVCSSWRSIILETPTFWFHMRLILTGSAGEMSYLCSALWLERAQNVPLCVSIKDAVVDNELNMIPETRTLSDSDISKVIEFLTPLMPHVQSLAINCQMYVAERLASRLLTCWAQRGSAGMAKRLEIKQDLDLPELVLPGLTVDHDELEMYTQLVTTFLLSLRSLYLENVEINWYSSVYSNLTELRIEFSFESACFPSQRDLVRVLAANPGLKCLALSDVHVTPEPGLSPVALNHLETLSLETMDAVDLALVLPLISSTSKAIRVALTLDGDPEFASAARSFFARTRVTVLHIDGELSADETSRHSISILFTPMPHLHTLSIQNCHFSDNVLQDLERNYALHNNGNGMWPNLKKVYFLQCKLSHSMVREFFRIHPLRMVYVLENDLRTIESWNVDVRKALQEDLSKAGAEFVWHEDPRKSAFNWTFVST